MTAAASVDAERNSRMSIRPLLLLGVAAFSPIATARPHDEPPRPRIVAPELVKDFGNVFQGDVKVDAFVIENGGDAPLELIRVVPRCGCTVAKYRLPSGEEAMIPQLSTGAPFLTLAPGERCELLVEFHSSGQAIALLEKEFHVESNDPDSPRLRLALRAHVRQIAAIRPSALNLGNVTRGDTARGELSIVPNRDLDVKLLSIAPAEHLRATLEEIEGEDGRTAYKVGVELLGTAPAGSFSKTLLVENSLGEGRGLRISILANVRPAVTFDTKNPMTSTLLDLGVKKAGESAEKTFEIRNARPETPWKPLSIAVESEVRDSIAASFEEIEPGTLYRVKVTAAAGLDRRFYRGKLVITAEHPETPKLEVQFLGYGAAK
jgi:hypothetical protein